MGNPDIKMALNENMTIGRQEGAQARFALSSGVKV